MNEQIEFLQPWIAVGQFADNLVKELEREVTDSHVLWRCRTRAMAQRKDADDVLFEIESGKCSYAVVHLTWSGEPELDRRWPDVRLFSSFNSWVQECMLKDHAEYMRLQG